MSELNWDHPKFYPCECLRCGWKGMSDEAAGGEAIADSGDYNDIVCPICIAPNGNHEEGHWVTLQDIPNPSAGLFKISKEIAALGGEIEERLKAKCQWEQMSRIAVIKSWGDPRTWKQAAPANTQQKEQE